MKLGLLTAIVGLFVIGANVFATESGYKGLLVEPPKRLNPHTMINHSGMPVTFPEKNGRLKFVFFGYTSCPDVCPMILGKMKQLIAKLEPVTKNIEYYFVSIDPQRDNVRQLGNFVKYYDKRIIGITGKVQTIKALENDFGILTRKFQGKSSFAYTLEHSSFIYLLDDQDRLRVMYPANASLDSIVSDVGLLEQGSARNK